MSNLNSGRNAPGNEASNIPAPGSRAIGVAARPKPVPRDAQEPPTMTGRPIANDLLPDICAGLVEVLGGTTYAVMAGIALRLLGSTRPTSDIDLFVPGSNLRVTQKFLDYGGNHFGAWSSKGKTVIWYRGLDGHRYRVYIWGTERIHHQFPTSAGGSVAINRVRVLKPALLLDHKCKSWAEHVARNDQAMKKRDGGDIMFLLEYMVNKSLRTTNREVSHATPEFFGHFLYFKRGSEPLFCTIGLLKARETAQTGGSEPRGFLSNRRAPY